MSASRPGVLLMTYGSPASLEREDVRSYLARVRGGREPDAELVDEFTRRYRVIGGSPLIGITRGPGGRPGGRPRVGRVETGMRFSEPSIVTGLRALADAGVGRGRRDHPVAAVLAAADGRLRARRSTRRRAEIGRRAPDGDRAPGRGTTNRPSSRRSRVASRGPRRLPPSEREARRS